MKLQTRLAIKQRLAMTQGLQQAIRILQLNQQDLQLEINEFLDSNIMLEYDYERDQEPLESLEEHFEEKSGDESLDFDEEGSVTVETDWDYYSGGETSYSAGPDEENDPLNQLTEAHRTTVHEDLLWQLEVSQFTERERAIGKCIISEINHEGYFLTSLYEIKEWLEAVYADITIAEMEAVLKRIQAFEPSGIAARSVEESLVNQINDLTPRPYWADHAVTLLEKGKKDLERLNIPKLRRLLGIDEELLRVILGELQRLDPKPGYKIGGSNVGGIRPEIIVTLDGRLINVALNDEVVPKLRINKEYATIAKFANEDGSMLRTHLSDAQGFIRSIHSRFDTMLMVAEEIVRFQRAFFFEGASAIRPLQLKDIADRLDFSESTISRAVNGKYMLCPTGTYELKFFFSNQVALSSADGDEDASAVAIRAELQKIIDQENPEKPYSDAKLVTLLEEHGYKIARRTVAKYRDVLGIPSSTDRKTFAKRDEIIE